MHKDTTRRDLLTRLMDDVSEELTAMWRLGEMDDHRFYRLTMAVVGEFMDDPTDDAMDTLFYQLTKEDGHGDC